MKVILISGKARHGKDTVAKIMKNYIEARHGQKVLIAHYADLLKYICKTFLDWDGKKDEKGRTLLQHVGTEVLRRKDPDIWVDFIIKITTLLDCRWDYIIIPDARFPNEVSKWRAFGYEPLHIRVVRDDFTGNLTKNQQNHPSEVALDSMKPDFYIHNNGTLGSLTEKIISLVEEKIVDGRNE